MDFVNIYFGIKVIVAGAAFALAVLCVLLLGIIKFFEWFKERRRDNWCKHDFKLYSTASFGGTHQYKCEKCQKKEWIAR
uniref:Uncharacterized protein n=1 Tax=Ochrobactrum phage ORM_20 TaxID=2985243 RepID=A0A9N6ZHN9_9VIRU|nr:hypothetical protein ORM20_00113 [Ochrobactrum phage ORM_20]